MSTLFKMSPEDVIDICDMAKENARVRLDHDLTEIETWAIGHGKFWRWFFGYAEKVYSAHSSHDWIISHADGIQKLANISMLVLLDDDDASFLAKHKAIAKNRQMNDASNVPAVDS